ncbi:MAG: hypothetical protein A2201_01660 [Alicyclobacillus sp. RIFOXYA1_FULL_53_8]|nr:MAG: hypothetical protein A2201_01660 [Alicyclobacillus sp. RIFOXYA1_FULL_53_8]
MNRLERLRRRPLPPVFWLVLLRVMRQKGFFRYLTVITAGGIIAEHIISVEWVKLITMGFFVFILYQWWRLTVPPLYEKPITEQFLVDPWSLRVSMVRYRFWFILSVTALWIVAGYV